MFVDPTERGERELAIIFFDLTHQAREMQKRTDAESALVLNEYYCRIARSVDGAGGRVVKFIGDGALIVFAPQDVDVALDMLLALRDDIDSWLDHKGWSCRLVVRAHVGSVIAGPFGPDGAERFDVIGRAVNTAASQAGRFALSAAFFRSLSSEARKQLKKHTPPVIYIPKDDRRPAC